MSSFLGVTFTVDQAPRIYDTNTQLNVIKPVDEIQYRSAVDTDAVAIAYLNGVSFDSDNVLSTRDRSASLFQNRVHDEDEQVVLTGISSYVADTNNILITDVFATDPTTGNIPLFYKHVISLDRVVRVDENLYALATGYELLDIKILDKDLNETNLNELYIDYTTGLIYSNVQHEYNATNDEYTVYYVQYTVRAGAAVATYTEIYDAEPIYRVAVLDDIDLMTMLLLTDGRKVYLIEEGVAGFAITLPASGTYAFKTIADTKLRLIRPNNKDSTELWEMSVSNAEFLATLNGTQYKYYVPEFGNQSFDPSQPYKRAVLETATILSRNLIKVDENSIYEDTSTSLYLDVFIANAAGSALAAFTTNPALDGFTANNGAAYQYWTPTSRVGIRSVDHNHGFIDIDGFRLYGSYTVTATYYYEESNYNLIAVDFNPATNPDLIGHKVAFFVSPEVVGGTKLTESVSYLKINEVGKVYESNWSLFDNTAQALSAGPELFYEQDPADFLNVSSHEVFTHQYSTESGLFTNNIRLILGDVSLVDPFGTQQVQSIDTRIAGGGVRNNLLEAAKELNEEVGYYWNEGLWDGLGFPGNSAFYMEIPVESLENAGGTFTQNDVKEIVYRYAALGVYPAIHAYGADVTISGILPSAEAVSFEWNTYSGMKYDVYYAQQEDGPWTKHNTLHVDDNPSGNSYMVSGLSNNTTYWFNVVPGVLTVTNEFQPRSTQFVGPVADGAQTLGIKNVFAAKTVTLGP